MVPYKNVLQLLVYRRLTAANSMAKSSHTSPQRLLISRWDKFLKKRPGTTLSLARLGWALPMNWSCLLWECPPVSNMAKWKIPEVSGAL